MTNLANELLADSVVKMAEEVVSLKAQLAELRGQAADAEIKWDGSEFTVQNVRDGFSYGVTPVFIRPAPQPQPATPIRYMNRFTGVCFTLEQQPGAATDTDVYIPLVPQHKGE